MGKKSSKWFKAHINDEFVKLANKGFYENLKFHRVGVQEQYSNSKKLMKNII